MDRSMASLCSHGKSMRSKYGIRPWTIEIFNELAGCSFVPARSDYGHWVNDGIVRGLRCRGDDTHFARPLCVCPVNDARVNVTHLYIRQHLAHFLGKHKPGLHPFIATQCDQCLLSILSCWYRCWIAQRH